MHTVTPVTEAPAAHVQPKPQGCTNLQLRQLTRRVSQRYDVEMARVGLKTTQYSLLSYVVKLGPIRPADLALVGWSWVRVPMVAAGPFAPRQRGARSVRRRSATGSWRSKA